MFSVGQPLKIPHLESTDMSEFRFKRGEEVIQRWDEIFRALSAEPRRQLIVSLLDAPPDETVPLPESAVNPNVPEEPENLRRKLYHQHLPTLSEFDFIEWDRDPLVATRGPRFEEVAIVFEALHGASTDMPDSLVVGCQRLEEERELSLDSWPPNDRA